MTVSTMRTGLAALAALGGLVAATASAQPPAAPAVPAESLPLPAAPEAAPRPDPLWAELGGAVGSATLPRVVRWPGGYMVVNGPEVIVRQSTPGGSTNVISGVGNGFGNRIVVDGGPGGGVTIVRGSRLGVGNTLVTGPDDLLIDLDEWMKLYPKPAPKVAPVDPAAAPAPSYKGKANTFWTRKAFSDAHDCNLYWCPATKLWFRYQADDDTYRPVPTQPPAPADEK